MFLFAQRGFLNFFGGPEKTGIFGLNLANFPISSPANFSYNLIIIKVVSLFHLNKIVPLNLYLLNLYFEALLKAFNLILFFLSYAVFELKYRLCSYFFNLSLDIFLCHSDRLDVFQGRLAIGFLNVDWLFSRGDLVDILGFEYSLGSCSHITSIYNQSEIIFYFIKTYITCFYFY